MRKNSIKTAAVTAALSAVMSISCGVYGITAFAAPAEISTDTTTAPVSSDTEVTTSKRSTTTTTTTAASESSEGVTSTTTVSESSLESGEIAEQTTAVSTVTTTQPVETELENPYNSGMLADDDFYKSVVDYLADGVNLDLSGTAILVDESTVNEDKQTDSENNENGDGDTADSTEKLMYTVVSRDGSTFYIIIDKGGEGENVYFLNKVDIIDLASLINTEDENLSTQEKAILNEANMSAATENDEENPDEENEGGSASSSSSSSSGNTGTSTSSTAKSDNTTLYLIVGVAAVAAIGIGWYFKVGPGKKNKASFDETDDEEDDEEEEYYDEEESEEAEDEDAPEEEAYDEE